MKAAPMPKLGRLWGPFYRLCRPGGPRMVIHFHKWSEVRHDVDDGGQIIGSCRYCAGCATRRGLPDAATNVGTEP